MRNSSLLKWVPTSVNKNNKLASNKDKDEKGNKKWIHNPETLKNGHVAYLVKFLGCTEVDKPKGIEVVKQGIQKLKFNQQLKKSEGSKTPKAELTISVEGVAIQEPKTKKILHQYPLHKISYCADDKAEKRFFSFISKDGDGKHTCFVFVSDKLAEEITLTIGQAFELAYKKYLDTSGKELETQKQLLTLQKRIEILENENSQLKSRLRDVSKIKGEQDIQEYLATNKLNDICEVTVVVPDAVVNSASDQKSGKTEFPDNESVVNEKSLISNEQNDSNQLISFGGNAGVDEKLDGLSLDDLNDEDFNPRIHDVSEPESSMAEETHKVSEMCAYFRSKSEFPEQPRTPQNRPAEPESSMTEESQIKSFGTNPFSTKSTVLNSKASLQIDPFEFGTAYAKSNSTMQFNNGNIGIRNGDAFSSNNSFYPNNANDKKVNNADPFGMESFDNTFGSLAVDKPKNTKSMAKDSIAINSLSIDDFDPLKDGKLN